MSEWNQQVLLEEMRKLGWENPLELTVHQFVETGRGLCSKIQTVRVGDEIINLPLECLITLLTIEKDAKFLHIFKNNNNNNNNNAMCIQTLLSCYLIYQRHKPKNDYMRAYIDSLPTDFSMPYFCDKQEISTFPENVQNYLKRQISLINDCHKEVQNSIQEAATCDCCNSSWLKLLSIEEFQWAWFVVNSRSVYVDLSVIGVKSQLLVRDKPNMALAPFMDLFNHSPKISNKASVVKKGSGRFSLLLELTDNRNEEAVVSPFEQIFISYGELPDLKLLMEYGMVLAENEHNLYAISRQQLERFSAKCYGIKAGNFAHKFAYLEQRGLTDNLFLYEQEEHVISHNLLVLFNLLFYGSPAEQQSYNRIVFGDSSRLKDCSQILHKLLEFLILEYTSCLANMEAFETVTESHKLVKIYIKKTVKFFQILQKKKQQNKM